MSRRPTPVAIVGWLFVLTGAASLVGGIWRFVGDATRAGATAPTAHDMIDLGWVVASALIALVGGVFVLRGRAWARWVCAAWLGAHVVLSLWHSTAELAVHALFFVVIVVLLWWPRFARASASE